MRILLVDNGSRHIDALSSTLAGYGEVVRKKGYEPLNEPADAAELVVLSGGHRYGLVASPHKWAQQRELIDRAERPILGICLGLEMMILAHGGTLAELDQRVESLVQIDHQGEAARVYEGHRWVASTVPSTFQVLATSPTGPEIIENTALGQIGFQFHPEVTEPANDGLRLLDWAISRLIPIGK